MGIYWREIREDPIGIHQQHWLVQSEEKEGNDYLVGGLNPSEKYESQLG